MIMSVRFSLSYDLLNAIVWPSEFVHLSENAHCCHGRRHDLTCSHRKKFYEMWSHNIIYDMTLSREMILYNFMD